MADAICRWRNGTPKTVVELVNSMPHEVLPVDAFRRIMADSVQWGNSFFRTAYQLAVQLALYYESEDGFFYPRFDHPIDEEEADAYLHSWFPKYYVPNPYVNKDGFNNITCPTLFLKSLYDYTKAHPNCTYKEAYESVFKEPAKNNDDIIRNYINSYGQVLTFSRNGILNITDVNPDKLFPIMDRNDKKAFFESFKFELSPSIKDWISNNQNFLTAIRTKPFILLAGISGTGKSRIVRKLAQATDDIDVFVNDEDRWKCPRPANFELIQVKPNWHNSMDVVGFQSNIPVPHYEFTPFVDFVVKAWCHEETPFFLCLDEMNLAPVEEYFAEFLSAIESRSIGEDGEFGTDPIIKPFDSFGIDLSVEMIKHFEDMGYVLPNKVETRLRKKGLTLPKNLIVMGTVNMDETTFSFSRKVLDRAMSIEMNEVDYDGFIEGNTEYNVPKLTEQNSLFVDRPIFAQEVKDGIESQNVMDFLKGVNEILEGTPFKLGYRAANEAILYVAADKVVGTDNLNAALDDFTLMKILSRIEGDDSKLVTKDGEKLLDKLYEYFVNVFGTKETSKTLAKLDNMIKTLRRDHFVSFWG